MQTATNTAASVTEIPAIFATPATTTEPDFAIYVASLSDYNSGILHGVWIDALQDADEVQDAINLMLANSPTARKYGEPAEEWAIHDYSGFCGIRLSESEDIEEVCALAAALEEHGAAFAAFYGYAASGTDVATCISQFEDAYQGTFDTLTAWAEQYADDTGLLADMPENLRYYFDYEAWARDCENSGDIFTVRTPEGIAVFGHY